MIRRAMGQKGEECCLRLLQRYSSHSQHRFLSLFKICFYALIKLNYFSLLIHSLLELGKTKTRKRDWASLLFFPFINSFTTNPLWVVKTRLQIMNNILLYFDFLLRTSFSSPYWPLHHHTTIGPPPNSQTRPPPVSSMVIGARDKVWHPYNN